jgi:hypothetical protein
MLQISFLHQVVKVSRSALVLSRLFALISALF